MFIDLVFFILIIFAVFKGISRGFIVAVFSFLAFIIGLAAALKLSATVANYLSEKMNVSGYLLPFIAFLIVFIGVVIIIKWGAALVKKMVSVFFLGWVDALAGIVLYALMYLMAYSVILFFATKVHLISLETQLESKTYAFVEPFGPAVMRGIGKVVPFFSHMFSDLSRFFEGVAKKG